MQKQRILVAEDDEHIRELLTSLLGAHGYDVVSSVKNGQEAIYFFQDDGEAALIITDLKMPILDGVTDGLTLIRWAKQNYKDIPMILVTGNADDEDICREARIAGAYEIISKPFFPGALLAVIKTALDRPEIWEGV